MPPTWITVIVFMVIWLWIITFILVKIYKQLLATKTTSLPRDFANLPDQSSFFRYFSLVKYNPFADTGGEQSFVLVLLNGQKTGIIITSLHGRGVTRFYSKKVIKGVCEQDLSHEEKQALAQAQQSQP